MKTTITVESYFAAFPIETQALLQQVRTTIQKAAPDATETISYAIPTFKLHGNLVHYAAYKHHIGFYPGAGGIIEFANKLTAYKSAKGSVQFPLHKPIPFDIITKIVWFRVKQNLEKAAKKCGGN